MTELTLWGIIQISDELTWEALLAYSSLALLFSFFLGMAICKKTYPTFLILRWLTIGAIFPLLTFFQISSNLYLLLAGFNCIWFLLLVFDLFSLSGTQKMFEVRRETERVVSIGHRHKILLKIRNCSNRKITVASRDDLLPELFPIGKTEGGFDRRVIPPESEETLEYQILPSQRGRYQLEFVYLRLDSFFGYWRRFLKIPYTTELDVYPDLQQLREYEILAKSERLQQWGVRKIRRVGQDDDFERLRDYSLDDQYRFIDWNATARRNKLTVRDFQMAKNQRIIFLLDSGRMMTNIFSSVSTDLNVQKSSILNSNIQEEKRKISDEKYSEETKLSMFDYSINAMLMLSYIALKQGDEVGFLCFSDRVRQFILPKAGMGQMNHLIHGCFDIFPEQSESRYDLAFSELQLRHKKRALVVLMTNVNDQRNAEMIEQYLSHLRGKHLPLGVFLRDRNLYEPLKMFETKTDVAWKRSENKKLSENDQQAVWQMTEEKFNQIYGRPENSEQIWRAGAAAEILNGRDIVLSRLSAQGTFILDVFPEEITAPLINQYLQIKARRLL